MRGRVDGWLTVLAVASIALMLAGLFMSAGRVDLTIWGDRDLWRALSSWQTMGPEINGGARPPGGAFYLLLRAVLAIQPSVQAASVAVTLLFGLSLALLWRRLGPLVALTVAGSGILATQLSVWNPGFVLVFAVAATVYGYDYIQSGRASSLGVAAATIAIGMQIHLQITQVAIGLALAGVCYRPTFTRRHALALLAGLILPFLPYLTEAGAGLHAALAVPKGAMQHYVFADLRLGRKAEVIHNLFGGTAPIFAGFWVALPLMVADGLVAVLAATSVVQAVRGRGRDPEGQPVGVFVLIVLVAAVTAIASDVIPRHLVAVSPAAAAMTGVVAQRMRRSPGKFVRMAGILVVALLALRPLSLGIEGLLPKNFAVSSATAQAEIAATVKPRLYGSREAFEDHAAVFIRSNSGRWFVLDNGVSNHLSFAYQTTAGTPPTSDTAACLAIIPKDMAEGDYRKELAASTSFSGLGVVLGDSVAESANFHYLSYTTRDGNCLKTFSNGYVPTAFELAHLPDNAPPGAVSENGRAIFITPWPGRPYPLGVEIARGPQGYVATLHGRLLRGYTGLYFGMIRDASLCFTGPGGSHQVRFDGVTIGSALRATLAPWRAPGLQLPDGDYRVWLLGVDGKDSSKQFRTLLGRLDLPGLAATVDNTQDTLPEACLH